MTEHDFERARHRAHWHRVLGFFKGKPSLLLPFDLVRRQINVKSASYEGIREIDMDCVIGSVNRYHEFDREFLPRRSASSDRWSGVRKMFDSDAGFSPIKVYQIGEAFFVIDGNHRVSVARQLRMKTIEAEVIRFNASVPIDRNTDIANLIIAREYSDFLKQTNLDELRPQQNIRFTRPGRYATILEHIDKRHYFLGLELGRPISYEEAVESWYDSLYRPLLEIFEQDGILARFPKRTAADLYVWVADHLYYLRERYGDDIGLATAARQLPLSRLSRLSTASMSGLRRLSPGSRKTARLRAQAPALHALLRRLQAMERRGIGATLAYRVPSIWTDCHKPTSVIAASGAIEFWRNTVESILNRAPTSRIAGIEGQWSRRATVYNLFVRASCGFDHDGDGQILVLNRHGLRETGTFLKAIALLPYIQSLGCNVVHLLPICRVGSDGMKGSLGSPYAIANPYQLDETLSEPLVGLGPSAEFKAFVEAAHWLGIRVVVEFVFRTAAKDSEWIRQHPEWFYWIRSDVRDRDASESNLEGYGNPRFEEPRLSALKSQVQAGNLRDLPAPPTAYRQMFVSPPNRNTITLTDKRWLGVTNDGLSARIPGAFADWPPDDQQPPWGDVTYLRIYDHPQFNYIAYNTIRMYDEKLAKPENATKDLWDRIAGILPHFINRYGIDGAMIDMGHALPRPLMARVVAGARGVDPSFALWEEHFAVRPDSKAEGYNASIGNVWWHIHRPPHLKREILERLESEGLPLPYFATPETHNTPRCASRSGGIPQSRLSWIVCAFLPAIPFVHSGFELGEVVPVNTGLDFTPQEARQFPENALPLFNPVAYNWQASAHLIDLIRQISKLRKEFEDLITDPRPETFSLPELSTNDAIAYCRQDASRTVLVLANPSENSIEATVHGIRCGRGKWTDRVEGVIGKTQSDSLSVQLRPWQCLVFARHHATADTK